MASPLLAIFVHVVLIMFYLYVPSATCQCSRKPVIFNFGDSNSDTGGYAAAMGYGLRYAADGRPFLTDRGCDGRLILDFLCENVKTDYLSPYLKSLESDFSNGVNFAVSGAATRFSAFSLDVQIRQFKRFHNHSILLQFKGYRNIYYNLVGEDDFKNALYTMDIGQNDLSNIFKKFPDEKDREQVVQRIPLIISLIEAAMRAIYEEGGRKLWVHNTGPLGCLPQKLSTQKPNASQVDQHGCITRMNEAAKMFNSQLKDLCEKLRHEMKDSIIVYVDVYSIKYGLIANSSSYGFKVNPLMACCGYGGAPYNYDPKVECGVAGSTWCDQASEPHISWDGIHYSEAANNIVTSAILSGKYSMPSLRFNFFCE